MSPHTILTPTQEQVLSLIAAGSTATAAAASAGIHRNTISNWLRGSPAFSQALACVHFDRALHWREQAESLAPSAVETIRGIMADVAAPAAVRLKAAPDWMRIFNAALVWQNCGKGQPFEGAGLWGRYAVRPNFRIRPYCAIRMAPIKARQSANFTCVVFRMATTSYCGSPSAIPGSAFRWKNRE